MSTEMRSAKSGILGACYGRGPLLEVGFPKCHIHAIEPSPLGIALQTDPLIFGFVLKLSSQRWRFVVFQTFKGEVQEPN